MVYEKPYEQTKEVCEFKLNLINKKNPLL